MRASRALAVLGMAALCLYLAASAGAEIRLPGDMAAAKEERVQPAVSASAEAEWITPTAAVKADPAAPPPAEAPDAQPAQAEEGAVLTAVMESVSPDEIRETTIRGGLTIKNETGYTVEVGELLRRPPRLRLPAEGAQILILHTHGSEAYTPAGLDRYEANDNRRTADEKFSVIRVGDELAAIFEAAGLRVIHDREIYDYPSYTGSYTRSGEAAARYLAENPGIAVVLDIHRDALGSDGVVYKTMAEEEGTVASQIMLLCGTDESGLSHPDWRENLALALYLQARVDALHPTLMRPVSLVPQRYNQHLTHGSLILEVGSSGNTLQEALAAIRMFGEAAAPALAELAETPSEESSNP